MQNIPHFSMKKVGFHGKIPVLDPLPPLSQVKKQLQRQDCDQNLDSPLKTVLTSLRLLRNRVIILCYWHQFPEFLGYSNLA